MQWNVDKILLKIIKLKSTSLWGVIDICESVIVFNVLNTGQFFEFVLWDRWSWPNEHMLNHMSQLKPQSSFRLIVSWPFDEWKRLWDVFNAHFLPFFVLSIKHFLIATGRCWWCILWIPISTGINDSAFVSLLLKKMFVEYKLKIVVQYLFVNSI